MLVIKQFDTVAPFAGAWIEIFVIVVISVWTVSLPSRERGLKFDGKGEGVVWVESLPSRERGLKSVSHDVNSIFFRRSLRGSVD